MLSDIAKGTARMHFIEAKSCRQWAAEAKQGSGILMAADFANYKVTETSPITCSYRDYKFYLSALAQLWRRHAVRNPQCARRLRSEEHELQNSAAAIHTMT